ncbi:MAG: hypothetical protein ABH870_02885, partial [bacterium]
LSGTLTTTNADGLASTTLTLGTKTGNYIVMVTAEGSLRATFTATATPDVLNDIKILPDVPVPVDQDILFTATGYDWYRNEISGLSYTWGKDGAIGTLTPSPAGTSATLHTAPESCFGTITVATLTVTGSVTVKIVYGELRSVTIDPATATVEMQGTQTFTAQGLNQYGYHIKGVTYTWTLKPIGIGTLDTTIGQTVVFTATSTGTVDLQVIAAFGTRTATATATITVVPGVVHHINITPATATIEARGTSSFTAEAFNQYGYQLTGITQFNWQVVEGNGTISGSPGKTVVFQTNDVVGTLTLTASSSTVTGTTTVTVIHGNVSVVSVNPATAEVKVMGSQTFVASAVNRFGHPIPASELSYTWGLNNPIGGSITPTTVSATTIFTAGSKTGKVEITAEAKGRQATATVTVEAGPMARLVFVPPTAGTLTAGMPCEMNVQTQDEFGNPSPATIAATIIVNGDGVSRFAGVSSGAAWTTSGTFTITGTSNLTFYFKQNGNTTPVIVTAIIPGTTISATHSITILLLGSSSSGTVVGDDGKTTVEIGTSGVTGAGYIEIDTSGTSTANIVLAGNAEDDLDPKINRVEGALRKFESYNATITTVRICIPYQDSNPDDGYVDGVTPPMRESSLAMYHLVGTGTVAKWEKINSQVDPINNVVYANISSFSFYTLMGAGFEPTLEKAFVYPNPYYADKHAGMWITFDKLSIDSTIQIFTIAGELVDEIRADSLRMGWDTCNSAGEKVASGIYIYLIKDPSGNKKVGKLGVVR